MKTTLLPRCLLVGSLLAFAGPGHAQTPPSPPREAQKTATPPAKSEPARATPPADAPKSAPPAATPPPSTASVQQMTREFGEQSKALVDKRKALLERLNQAKTDEEKQRIVAELRQQQQERIDQQRELARQIREQMQNKRGEMGAASPGK